MLLALDITATFSEAKSATEPKRRGGRKTTIRAEIGSSGDCWAGLQMRGGWIHCPSLCSWHWRVDPAACSSNENHVLPGQEVHYWNQMCTSSGVIHFVIHPPPPSDWLTAKCSVSFVSLSRVTANATRQIPALTTWQTQSLMKGM